MKKCLQNMDIKDKKVLLRVDYNVPISNGIILDDTKITLTIDTIRYLLEHNCRIIILSHLGKVRNESDKIKYSLEPVANYLKRLLEQEIYFSKENFGPDLPIRVSEMKPRDILVLENTRFLDVPNKLESNCDSQVSEFWSSLGDVFVNDAFGTAHRRHASTYGISKYLPSCIGFLMQKEIEMLNQYVLSPTHPFTLIMGGAKMDDKMKLLESLVLKCDFILLGGGLANTCLDALGFNIGESISTYDEKVLSKVKEFLLLYKDKIILPLDVIVGSTYDNSYVKYKLIHKIDSNDMIFDIGIKTLEKYKSVIDQSKTVFLNGTVGRYEDIKFANGTKELLRILKESSASVIVGGGDASSSVYHLGYGNDFTYISSGGGATLEYISSGNLVALDLILEEEVIETLDL